MRPLLFILLGLPLALPACPVLAQESAYAQSMEALASMDYAAAWSHLDAETDEFWQAAGQSAVYYAAGDLGQTLGAAERALELRSTDLDLLYRASWAAVSLGDLARAKNFVQRLDQALQSWDFNAEQASTWERILSQLDERLQELRDSAKARAMALQRARWLSISGLIGVLLLIRWLGRQ